MSSEEYLTRSSKHSVLPSCVYYYMPTNASGSVSRALFKPQHLNFRRCGVERLRMLPTTPQDLLPALFIISSMCIETFTGAYNRALSYR